MRPAGFWIRAVAFIIDGLILMSVSYGLTLLGGKELLTKMTLLKLGGPFVSLSLMELTITIVAHLVPVIYLVVLTSKWGTTIGKNALGLKVIDQKTGRNISILKAFSREVLAKFISAIFIYLGFFWVGWNKGKKGWHDFMCSTQVVYIEEKGEQESEV